ncbi:MAG TPA: DUF3299 domain-containing protein [Rubrivivax sp.]|nr:DUF3299 domain-containing protein [Rubrivivax sp.]
MRPIALLVLASCLASGGALAQTSGVPLMKPALPSPAEPAAGAFRTITWEALVPPGWDPFKDFRGLDMQAMDDGDPRAAQMMKKMREAWDKAPVNAQLIGQAVRIPGFVVPLEDSKDGLKEFLLVPYFGACIHSPPPPSNQIIHVVPKTAAKGLRSMDTVWISGVLSNAQTDSYMGASSWRIEATTVAPYVEPKAAPKTERRE